MAGIGFELKRLFSKKGIFAIVRAYGYAGVVCTGPMLLGVVLLIGVRMLAVYGGASTNMQDLINCMITYTLLSSLIITSCFSMITTRYTSDCLYMEKPECVMPSFYGSIAIMLFFGCTTYAVFLRYAGIPLLYQFLCFILFGELIVVWTEMNYLTALKNYRGILKAFFYAITFALLLGYILVECGLDMIPALLFSVTLAYGIMMLWYYLLLVQYFPASGVSIFHFLQWFDRYPSLGTIGLFVSLGLYSHLVIMWMSPINVNVLGLYYCAPKYEVPALFAFLSILVTIINFVTSVEVHFYPKFKTYFSLYNDGGSLVDIKQAESEMRSTLQKELGYTYSKQFFTSVTYLILGSVILPQLPLGFNEEMVGIFCVLCVGYAFYAIGNVTMLIQLYFADNKGAFFCSSAFCIISTVCTYLFKDKQVYYGLGFLLGSLGFTICALVRLCFFLKKVSYHVLCSQPIVVDYRKGMATKFSNYCEQKYEKRIVRQVTNDVENS